jgi:hypothetical protein
MNEVINDLRNLNAWVIDRAATSANLISEFEEVPLEKHYAQGSLGAYHDVRTELEKLIYALESTN